MLLTAEQRLRAHGCRLLVAGASAPIANVMRLFGFDNLIPLTPSLDSAVELLRRERAARPSDA